MIENLSKDARRALVDVTPRVGAPIRATETAEVWVELLRTEMIGGHGGLTRKGLIAREQIMNEKLKEAFGA